jgi:hypothetical protein
MVLIVSISVTSWLEILLIILVLPPYYEYNNACAWRNYMRVRVLMNVHEPLKKSWSFERIEDGTVTVHFK